jgi:hypothetical protein
MCWISNTGQAFVAGDLDTYWRLDRELRSAWCGKSEGTLTFAQVAMDLLVNIDVSDIARAVAFYMEAFGLTVPGVSVRTAPS